MELTARGRRFLRWSHGHVESSREIPREKRLTPSGGRNWREREEREIEITDE